METSVNQSSEIKIKTHFSGKVVKTSLAGALVDIGTGTPAYLHVSQVVAEQPDQPIKMVGDILKVGHEVEVWVKKVRDGRVELTMQKPLDLDWKDLKADMVVKGKVVRLEKFGAFVEIGAERPGLVHISEMAHGYVKVPGDVVKEGDEIEAQVIEVNRRKKQIKLSMKALQPVPEVVEEKAKPTAKQNPARFAADPNREKKPARKPRRRTEEDNTALLNSFNETNEPEPTVMEMAMKAAMEKAKDRKKKQDSHKEKAGIKEQEEILSRTLENKLETK
jgi:predicted RNA-binding protein with RPS1 domain